ncbi:MAG: DUF4926 domain-containing protein [bacterium]|nr:DUF4926 domain-containing protein [bacterium]
MITLFSIVKSTRPIGSIPAETKGTVVFEYGKGDISNQKGFEVEFFDDNNNTIAVSTVYENQIVER